MFEILDFLVEGGFDAFCGAEFFVEVVDFGDEVFVGEGLGFEVGGEGRDAGLEGLDFLLVTFCFVAEGSLDLRLVNCLSVGLGPLRFRRIGCVLRSCSFRFAF